MKLAIMQPYFLPYLGYWQLLSAVDRFVIYDDVQYIKGGWVNRNRIKLQGRPAFLSLRLDGASPNKRICDIRLLPDPRWRDSLLRTLEQGYARAPFRGETLATLTEIVNHDDDNLAAYLAFGIKRLARHLGIGTGIVNSSRCYDNADLAGQERVIDICRREGAGMYLNTEGGRGLYQPEAFGAAGIDLRFITMRPLAYPQGDGDFISHLSIVDVLMWLGREATRERLAACDIS